MPFAPGNRKAYQRRQRLQNLGKCITDGKALGDTTRHINFGLRHIIEDQIYRTLAKDVETTTPDRIYIKQQVDELIADCSALFSRCQRRVADYLRTPRQSFYERSSPKLQAEYLKTLGLDSEVTPTKMDVKKAYRQKMWEAHPDINNSEKATTDAQQINEAYQYLLEVL